MARVKEKIIKFHNLIISRINPLVFV